MQSLIAFALAHASQIGGAIGAWIVIASFLNRKWWPQPAPTAPKWQRVAHEILIDTPSFLASIGKEGTIGPFTIPFATGSMEPNMSQLAASLDAITKRQTLPKVGAILVFFALSMSVAGCGTVGTNQVLTELEGGASLIQQDCLPGALADYNDVQTAIHSGGANWLTVAMDGIGCLEPFIMGELRNHHIGGLAGRTDALAVIDHYLEASDGLLASAQEKVPLPSITKAELRRMRLLITIERQFFATKVKAPK